MLFSYARQTPMALPAATSCAGSVARKLLFHSPPKQLLKLPPISSINKATFSTLSKNKNKESAKHKKKADLLVKRRTRSERELDEESFLQSYGNYGCAHVPVMLGEVLDVFSRVPLKSFVDCTIGAGGHSSAIIQAHPEMKLYVGLDVDPVAHEMAQSRINGVLHKCSDNASSDLNVYTFMKNFVSVESVLHDIDENLLATGVDGILMDLGMSSMQVNNAQRGFSVLNDGPLDMRMNPQGNVENISLHEARDYIAEHIIQKGVESNVEMWKKLSTKIREQHAPYNVSYYADQATLRAEDILNSWPDIEVGRILRDYGEESNWYSLQNKIVKARSTGGLHSTRQLLDLIRNSTSWSRGGRQGWIKTATRVFQALRIAVNDELNTLKDSIDACFHSLSSGGRLAVISFHSLEDRIVKQAFLNIINRSEEGIRFTDYRCSIKKEAWIKQVVQGLDATILTKRPITPSEKEESLNPRSRSAKLRVIQKA